MKKYNLKYYLLCDSASVSWLLNLRSDALPNTPIIRAYALIRDDATYEIFSENLIGINYKNFAELEQFLLQTQEKTGIDYQSTPKQIINLLQKNAFNLANPVIAAKSQKSQVEMQGFENAHLRDGVALTKFMYWLENNWKNKTETDVCEKLYSLRQEHEYFYSNSFDTIAAYGSNAAIVHYNPQPDTNKKLEAGNVLLLDSGAQYFDGTTDVTRTIAIGTVESEEIKRDFTLVLKAHIALETMIFPLNTPDKSIDCITRRELWKYGLDYKHGTGHGVGHFSAVHEMPPSISEAGSGAITENMVLSVEPGLYLENKYGIRIENLVKTVLLRDEPYNGQFIKFEPLTVAPIDKRLIDKYLLSQDEQDWLNSYHEFVFKKLEPYMNNDEKIWLKDACSPL